MKKESVKKYDARACAQQMLAGIYVDHSELRVTDLLARFNIVVILVNRSKEELGGHNARIDLLNARPVIYLRRGLSKKKETQAILHELGHMYLIRNGISLVHEERFCDVFANEIMRTIDDSEAWTRPILPHL